MEKQYMVERWSKYRIEAFWKRVEKRGENDCWVWIGYRKAGPKTRRLTACLAGRADLPVPTASPLRSSMATFPRA